MDEILGMLNEDQIKPVMDTEGAVLVLAGAGSGKTRVLTARAAYIIREGKARIQDILAITFTNKAAGEMKERLLKMLGQGGDSRWICTIHSMCVKILREFGERSGIKPNFSIYSETERNNVIKRVFSDMDFDDEKLLKHAKYHIANAKMLGLDPDLYAKKYARERGIDDIAAIYSGYERHLKANNALDFDDLLLYTLRLLKSDRETLAALSGRFKYILVDEFQDTNAVQYEIMRLLAGGHGNIFCVGDDDQSIYGWRGAEIENILRFDRDFPQAKIYKLERNYRSTKSILSLANSIIRNNLTRRGKVLWTQAEEGDKPVYFQAEEESGEALYAANIISQGVMSGGRYSDYAVLMRINALTRSYEQEFTKYGIPYKVFGGFKFFERKEIKDVLAYMRLLSNPFDSEAAERIINVPKRGIGQRTVQIMQKYAADNGLSFYDAALDCDLLPVPRSMRDKLFEFASLIKRLISASHELPVGSLVREIVDEADIRASYDDGTDEGDGKLANIDEFIASVDDFTRLNPRATLDEYLSQITLYSDLDEMDDSDYVTIATIHAVKGLEFNTVFLCGLEDGIMPTSRSEREEDGLEEERRLMYVAITRAEKKLYLTRSKSRYLYGHRDLTRPSRFISELASELGVQSMQTPYYYAGGGKKYVTSYHDTGAGFGKAVYSSADGYKSDIPRSGFKPSFGGAAPAKSSGRRTKSEEKSYSVGMRVRHSRFGTGMIISVKGGTLQIAFEGQGIKELSAAIAPLEIL